MPWSWCSPATRLHRLIVFDFRPEIDEHREAYDAARARLAEAGSTVVVETLHRRAGARKVVARDALPPNVDDDDNSAADLHIRQHGCAEGRDLYPEPWPPRCGARPHGAGQTAPTRSITLNFMPMSHVMGRASLYGTLAHGGTAYFAAKSDLSTFLEDLALVRPTQLNFVPRVGTCCRRKSTAS